MQRNSLWFALSLAVVSGGLCASARAQQIKPYFLVIADTSGSMEWCAGGTTASGGSNDCSCRQNNNCANALRTDQNSCGFGQNKIGDAKCALQRIIDSTGGDAVWGLMGFERQCATNSNSCTGAGADCGTSPSCDDGMLFVPIQDGNSTLMREWVDGVVPPNSCDLANHRFPHELGTGLWTPLARSLQRANEYLRGMPSGGFLWATDSNTMPTSPVPVSDPTLACRPVSVILLTDGDDTCTADPTNDPPARAATLNTGDVRATTRAGKAFKTYVIGFGASGGNFNPTVLNNVASMGGTGMYYPATNERQLSLVLNQIVADAQPPVEICNNQDDDCDTKVDEGLPKFCNKPQGVNDPTLCDEPDESNCDGQDDDCDGIIDEGLKNACGLCGAVPTEVCDNVDNDCDSRVDENATSNMMCGDSTGECEAGKLTCVNGMERCEGEIGPKPEICDCNDNDCDGVTDEEGGEPLCPDGQRCAGCRCVEFCVRTDEFEARCPAGLAAEFQPNGECLCIVDTCDHDACPKSTIERDSAAVCAPKNDRVAECICRAGACIPRCDGVMCGTDQICSPKTERCVENNCRGLGCASGSICDPVSTRCVKDDCADANCADDQVCRGGKCEKTCAAVQCKSGEVCRSGACNADGCAGKVCGSGEACDPGSGECADDRCDGVSCPSGQTCSPASGECEAERCWDVKCPAKQFCVSGECVLSGDTPNKPPPPPSPPAPGNRLIATGGGGCACSVPGQAGVSPGSPVRGLWLCLAALGMLWLRRRSAHRRAAGSQPTAAGASCGSWPGLRGSARWLGLLGLLIALLGGCRVSPLCLDCKEDASTTLDANFPEDEGANPDLDAELGDAAADAGDAAADGGNDLPADAGDPTKCQPKGEETCNGMDDDCDFRVDEDVVPTSNDCNQVGVCAGTLPTCSAGGFACRYAMPYEKTESLCDGLDNDCNGSVDESFKDLGKSCEIGTGACRVSGNLRCNAAKTGLFCEITSSTQPVDEVCNGKDDDCDGLVDEPKAMPGSNASYVHDDVVKINDSLWIYTYEASRPDADASKQGIITARTCSRAGVLPWTNVTYTEAVAACQTVGMTVCDLNDWLSACHGKSGGCNWSFTPADGGSCNTYSDDSAGRRSTGCNGHDVTQTPGSPETDALEPTGSKPACFADLDQGDVFDLSGNAKEWTTGPMSPSENPLRGGSYNNSPNGLTCDFDFSVGAADLRLPNVGFRCCTASEP